MATIAKTIRPFNLENPVAVRELVISSDGLVTSIPTAPTISTGTGAPSTTQPRGSVYLRSDGAQDTTVYINTDGAATWAALTGA
jgi:hypothetical protein